MSPVTDAPEWVAAVDAADPEAHDVAAILAAGGDPFSTLTGAAFALAEGAALVVRAPFDPEPLRRHLEASGFRTWAEAGPGGRWRVRVQRLRTAPPAAAPPADDTNRSFWLEEGVLHLDVRRLPPPKPLREILAFLDHGPHGGRFVVHVPHAPIHLFPELEERGWRWTIQSDDDDGCVLLLERDDAP